jgi:hypothetical protein
LGQKYRKVFTTQKNDLDDDDKLTPNAKKKIDNAKKGIAALKKAYNDLKKLK